MRNIRIGIIGTRGIPNRYGGFEELAEVLSIGLVERGYQIFTYNPQNHENQEKTWHGVNIVHKKSPEWLLAFSPIVYDLFCVLDCRKRKLDFVIQLGYGTSALWSLLLSRRIKVLTNMDGLEWKRRKYNWITKNYIKIAERIAVRRSKLLIADSPVIAKYLRRYNKEIRTIAYGAYPFESPESSVLEKFHLRPYQYYLLIARMVPENNIEVILDGYCGSNSEIPFLVIGDTQNEYGRYITQKYRKSNVTFHGSLFDKSQLNNLRYHSKLYFHGHSVGGTNPSLLEAMACSALICVHGNVFNRHVVDEETTIFFKTRKDVIRIIDDLENQLIPNQSDYRHEKNEEHASIQKNLDIIKKDYLWDGVVDNYRDILEKLSNDSQK